jgi:Bacterial PH domain
MAPDSARPRRARRSQGQAGQVQTFRSPTALVVWVVWLLFAVANWIDIAVQGRDHLSAVAAALLLLVTGIAYTTAQRPRIIADPDGVTVRNPLRDHRITWASISKVDLIDVLRVHCDWSGGPRGSGGEGFPPGSGGSRGVAPPGQKSHSKIISSWAVHYSRRRQFAADARARRASRGRRSPFGLPYGTPASSAGASSEAEAEKVVKTLNERATAAQAEAVWASGTVPIAGSGTANGTSPAARVEAAEATVGTMGSPGIIGVPAPPTSTWSWPAILAIVIPALILLVVCLV